MIGGDEFEPRDTIEKITTKYFELDRKERMKSIHVSASFFKTHHPLNSLELFFKRCKS